MYKFLILFLSVFLTVRCDLNKAEGAECEWEGVKGTCVNQNRCFTSLDDRSEKQPVCSTQGENTIICCTDCELVNNTSNFVFSPRAHILEKVGGKSRDSCLDYLDKQPYRCRDGGFYSGIKRQLVKEKNCHSYSVFGVGGASPVGSVPGQEYPHQALVGMESNGVVSWISGGTIVSDRFILTAAHIADGLPAGSVLKRVATGVVSLSNPDTKQERVVKRFIKHPNYKSPSMYHDIALIELDSPLEFNENVMPACLYTATSETQTALTTTWRDLKTGTDLADTIQTINVEAFTEEECKKAYPKQGILDHGFDSATQLCYGSKRVPSESSKGFSGEPLMATEQFESCIFSVIGVSSLGPKESSTANVKPNIYTKLSHYLPWVESVVWP